MAQQSVFMQPMRDGTSLYTRRCPPGAESRGWVLLVHGIAEHSGRYDHVIERLNRAGYGVFCFDGRGHGKSAQGAPSAYFDSFEQCVDDTAEMHRLARQLAGVHPCFLLGHSLGALVLVRYLIRDQPSVPGAVLTSPPLYPRPDVSPLVWPLACLLSALWPRLPMLKLDSSTISRDPGQVARYDSDPLNFRGRLAIRPGVELLRAARAARAELHQLAAPLLLVHGTADRVADIQGARLVHERASSTDRTLRECDGLYHEVLNEPEWPVLSDEIVGWLNHRSGAPRA